GRDGVTYADLETAPVVLLVGFDPEEESPIVFLRLRRAARDLGVRVVSVTPFASPAVVKTGGEWLPTVPGDEPRVLDALAAGDAPARPRRGGARGRAPRRDPGRPALRGGALRRDRRAAGVGPPPCGRAGCRRGGLPARPAPRRPTGHRRRRRPRAGRPVALGGAARRPRPRHRGDPLRGRHGRDRRAAGGRGRGRRPARPGGRARRGRLRRVRGEPRAAPQ